MFYSKQERFCNRGQGVAFHKTAVGESNTRSPYFLCLIDSHTFPQYVSHTYAFLLIIITPLDCYICGGRMKKNILNFASSLLCLLPFRLHRQTLLAGEAVTLKEGGKYTKNIILITFLNLFLLQVQRKSRKEYNEQKQIKRRFTNIQTSCLSRRLD